MLKYISLSKTDMYIIRQRIEVGFLQHRSGPRLMTDTQHSTLHVFEWGNPECGV